jgi:uncharacterized RDD family membrane protein YckC
MLAYLIDMAVAFGWFILCGIAVQAFQQRSFGVTSLVLSVLMFLPLLFYHLLCEIFMNGQSVGKKATDIKVIKLSGHAPTVGDYLLRWVFRVIDISFSFGLIGIVTMAINDKGQRLGDLAAGTSVIRTRAVRRNSYFNVKTEEDYAITFPEVSILTDKDMALIRKLFYKALLYKNEALLQRIAERTQEVMDVKTDLSDEQFLKTVIKDYHHLMSGQEVY